MFGTRDVGQNFARDRPADVRSWDSLVVFLATCHEAKRAKNGTRRPEGACHLLADAVDIRNIQLTRPTLSEVAARGRGIDHLVRSEGLQDLFGGGGWP
jgi:hypothetical protein